MLKACAKSLHLRSVLRPALRPVSNQKVLRFFPVARGHGGVKALEDLFLLSTSAFWKFFSVVKFLQERTIEFTQYQIQ